MLLPWLLRRAPCEVPRERCGEAPPPPRRGRLRRPALGGWEGRSGRGVDLGLKEHSLIFLRGLHLVGQGWDLVGQG